MGLEWSAGGKQAAGQARIQELDERIRKWPRHAGNDPYKEGLERLASVLKPMLPTDLFAVAYNEFCAPSVPEALEDLIERGAQRILVIPTMLTPGGLHSEKDIPKSIRQTQEKHAHVRIEYLWPFELKEVAALLSGRIQKALSATAGSNSAGGGTGNR